MKTRTAVAVVCLAGLLTGSSGVRALSSSRQTSPIEFVGTTPANVELLKFFGAPPSTNAELVEWSLTLTSVTQYTLRAGYGMTEANFPGIHRDRRDVERRGTWTAAKGTKWSSSEDVIDLGGLAFVRVGPSILHILTSSRSLMTGNGSASFSLNRTDAAEPPADPSLPSTIGPGGSYSLSPLAAGTGVYGIFEGRTPCLGVARELSRVVAPGCPKLKFRLTLLQDSASHKPTTFKLEGTLYRSEREEGRWKISEKGVVTLERPNGTILISLLRVSDDAVMFLDRSGRLLVGNALFSYTLERRKP